MTIIYAVICRAKDAAILVEVCDRDVKGTFGTVMIELLQHLRDHPNLYLRDNDCKTFIQRNAAELDFFSHFLEACSAAAVLGNDDDENEMTNDTDNHYFHVYFKNDVYYCCLSDDSDPGDQKVYDSIYLRKYDFVTHILTPLTFPNASLFFSQEISHF
jgi:hypothetical protein